MKTKLFTTLAFSLLSIGTAFAYDAEIEGIYYNFIDGEAEVTFYAEGSDNREAYKRNVMIPEEVTYNGQRYPVTAIGDHAFEFCSEITDIDLPQNITRVGDYAFYYCTSMDWFRFAVDSRVTSIGEYAFAECSKLPDFYFPVGVTSVGENTFYNCSKLSSVEFSDAITSIGDYAFDGCEELDDIEFPEGLETIGERAFRNCSTLSRITIPASVTTIGEAAFVRCTKLADVTLMGNVANMGNDAFYNTPWFDAYLIDPSNAYEGVIYLGTTALKGLDPSMTSLTLKPGTTAIAEEAFIMFEGLTSVSIPEGVKTIGYAAFGGCSNLTSVSIPSSVTFIEEMAFAFCPKLVSIQVDAANEPYTAVDNILYDKAMRTIVLCPPVKAGTSFTISDGIEAIGDAAFVGCEQLTEINFPQSLQKIGQAAFAQCKGLTTIYLPENVDFIGQSAFQLCSALTDVYALPTVAPYLDSNVFDDVTALTLHVSEDSYAEYSSSAVWEDFIYGSYMPVCATPTITFAADSFAFACDTPGAEYHYTFSATGGRGSSATAPTKLTIVVRAIAPGYTYSEPAECTINIGAGDVNRDGSLTIADVTKLVDKLVGK